MRTFLLRIAALAFLALTPALIQAGEVVKATLTITKFRPLAVATTTSYVDADVAMTPHPTVRLVTRESMPTFVCKTATDFEITIASSDGRAYRPLSVSFQQLGSPTTAAKDPSGENTFASRAVSGNTVNFHCRATRNDSFEFFIVVQEVATGNIGLIDPLVEIEIDE
ncbi:MAG: hypothetical protein HYV96_00470 [Opitutae bacterium]|nr:hypothetical protein [Opitutae bacterium]